MESVNFGNLSVDSGGQVSFSGLSSGIDSKGAVDNIIAAKRIPADLLDLDIQDNDAKIAALGELQASLKGVKETLSKLYGAVSFGNANDIFENKQAFATTSRADGTAPSAAGSLLGLTVSNSAEAGSHSIEVLRVAKAHKIGSLTFNSASTDLGTASGGAAGSIAGSFDINGSTITVGSSDTLLDLRDRINNANSGASATKVTASVVSISTTQHVLVLTADELGSDITLDNEVGSALSELGISSDGGSTFANQLQAAQTARLKADGLLDPDRYESDLVTSASVALSSYSGSASFPGSFDIVGTGTATVNFTSTTTLTDLAGLINAENATTGVTATVVQDGTGSRLVMSHDSSNAFNLTDTGGLLADLGVDNALVIERSTNNITDLFGGITLSLFQGEEGTTVNVDIERDLSAVKSQITSFVESYNALKTLINQHTLVDPNTGQATADTGVLFGNRTLATVESRLASLVGGNVDGADAAFSVLAQIGIGFVDNGSLQDPLLADTLTIDDTKMDSTLLSNPDEVRRLFGFDLSSSDPRVVMLGFTGATSYSGTGYTLNIGTVGTGSSLSATVTDSAATLDDAVNSLGATVSGSFDINGTPVAYDITTDSLDSLVDAINAASIARVSASIETTSTGDKQLRITSTDDPLVVDNDTGDLLAALALAEDSKLIDNANVDGLANGSDDGTVTIDGSVMTVTDQSGAQGLNLLYTGNAAASGISLNFTIGLGAQLFFAIDDMLDATSGTVTNEIESLKDQNQLAQDRITRIDERLAIQRQSLLARFLAMEQAIATMNSVLDSVRQITDAMFAGKN